MMAKWNQKRKRHCPMQPHSYALLFVNCNPSIFYGNPPDKYLQDSSFGLWMMGLDEKTRRSDDNRPFSGFYIRPEDSVQCPEVDLRSSPR